MKYLNQFHKESSERKLKKIAESQKHPMSPEEIMAYLWSNFERAKRMELVDGIEQVARRSAFLVAARVFHIQVQQVRLRLRDGADALQDRFKSNFRTTTSTRGRRNIV